MNTTAKKSAAKKSAAKKTGVKKAAVKKTATKKAAPGKTSAKKTPVKKATTGKAAVPLTPSTRELAGGTSEKDLQALSMDIDRQMKLLAEMNTRVIIAKDQLADFQENISAKIKAFQKRNAGKPTEIQKDIMTTLRETRDEAAKMFKDSRALHETYESLAKHIEKGRVAAAKEMKKAEAVFLEKFHVVEEKVLKKAGEIKKNLKS